MQNMQIQRHAPIREQVVSILRAAIIEHRLSPGQVLVERELCELTSASRPSIREALRQLEAEGLVQSQNGRGMSVSVVDADLARDIYQVRAELEGLAAQLFAKNADEALRAELRSTVDRIAQATCDPAVLAPSAILAAKNDFYAVLFRGTGNSVLQQMVQALQRRVNQLRAMTLSQPGRPEQSLAEIRLILSAIERRNVHEARTAAVHHVHMAARAVRDGAVPD